MTAHDREWGGSSAPGADDPPRTASRPVVAVLLLPFVLAYEAVRGWLHAAGRAWQHLGVVLGRAFGAVATAVARAVAAAGRMITRPFLAPARWLLAGLGRVADAVVRLVAPVLRALARPVVALVELMARSLSVASAALARLLRAPSRAAAAAWRQALSMLQALGRALLVPLRWVAAPFVLAWRGARDVVRATLLDPGRRLRESVRRQAATVRAWLRVR